MQIYILVFLKKSNLPTSQIVFLKQSSTNTPVTTTNENRGNVQPHINPTISRSKTRNVVEFGSSSDPQMPLNFFTADLSNASRLHTGPMSQ